MAELGSFGAGVPGGSTDPVQLAVQARQEGGQAPPQLSQTLTGSPVGSQIPPAPVTPISPQGQPQADKPQVQNAEVEIILKALTQRLNTISKLENPPQPTGGGGTYAQR